jgi:hypothetical protein
MTLDLPNGYGPVLWMSDHRDVHRECGAENPQAVVPLMTARKQAEAAWRPDSRYSVDELEALIREHRRIRRVFGETA